VDPDRRLLENLALARATLDRAAIHRADGPWLDRAWADPGSRVLVIHEGKAPVLGRAEGSPQLALVAPQSVGQHDDAERHFLGVDSDGVAFFAIRPRLAVLPAAGAQWFGLRDVGADLSDRDAGLLVTAVSLGNWHDSHQHCPRCGAPTYVDTAGWIRRCPSDDSEHYPRTDPAIIVLVIDAEDRALLGHGAAWPDEWYSTLAGFVEPGESAEAAVRREVAEESGVVVGEVAYLGSQPWPFPSSLMLGYHAWATDATIVVDGVEMTHARWFSRADLLRESLAGTVRLPQGISIARRLVERWYGGRLPGAWSGPRPS